MDAEKTKILTMLSEGKISVEESQKLLEALNKNSEPEAPKTKKPRFICVQVDSSEDEKVNIKIPIQVLRSGVKFASLLPDQAQNTINKKMKGINLNDINSENVDEFIESMADFSVNVDGSDKVKIFCE